MGGVSLAVLDKVLWDAGFRGKGESPGDLEPTGLENKAVSQFQSAEEKAEKVCR